MSILKLSDQEIRDHISTNIRIIEKDKFVKHFVQN